MACCAFAQAAEPGLEVTLSDDTPRVGQAFEAVYTLSWQDAAETYLYLPGALPELEWGTWRILEQRSSAVDGTQTIVITTEITPAEIGDFDIPALELAYTPDAPDFQSAEPSMVSAPSQPINVGGEANPFLPVIIGVVGAVLLVAGISLWLILRGSKSKNAAPVALGPDEKIRDALHAAQRFRLDGDYYGFYQQLGKVAGIAAAQDNELITLLNKRTQSVGYGGVRPTEDELNGDQRAIERAIALWKEDRAT